MRVGSQQQSNNMHVRKSNNNANQMITNQQQQSNQMMQQQQQPLQMNQIVMGTGQHQTSTPRQQRKSTGQVVTRPKAQTSKF